MTLILVGCDSGPTPQPQVEAARLDAAKQERAIFVKSGGDYATLSPADHAELVKLAGGEQQAKQVFEFMKAGAKNAVAQKPPGQ